MQVGANWDGFGALRNSTLETVFRPFPFFFAVPFWMSPNFGLWGANEVETGSKSGPHQAHKEGF